VTAPAPPQQQVPPGQPVPPPQDSDLDSPLFVAAVAAALLTVGPVATVIAALKVRFALSHAAWTALSGSLSIAMEHPPPLVGVVGPASAQTARQNLARRAQFVVSAAKRLVSDIAAGRAALPEPERGPAEAQAAELNVLRGAQFKEAKHARLQADIARGRSGDVGAWPAFQAGMARERRYYSLHLAAMWNRARAAGMVDMAAQEHGNLLSWNTIRDKKASAECVAADKHNFHADRMPAIGWPGGVHPFAAVSPRHHIRTPRCCRDGHHSLQVRQCDVAETHGAGGNRGS
jgi:hypothetical protein